MLTIPQYPAAIERYGVSNLNETQRRTHDLIVKGSVNYTNFDQLEKLMRGSEPIRQMVEKWLARVEELTTAAPPAPAASASAASASAASAPAASAPATKSTSASGKSKSAKAAKVSKPNVEKPAKEKKPTKAQLDLEKYERAKKVRMPSEEVKQLKKFIALLTKQGTVEDRKKKLLNAISGLQKAMTTRKITKTSPLAAEILEIQNAYLQAAKEAPGSATRFVPRVSDEQLAHYVSLVGAERVYKSVELIGRFINFAGRERTGQQIKSFYNAMVKSAQKVDALDPYADRIKQITNLLRHNSEEKTHTFDLETFGLSGLAGLLGCACDGSNNSLSGLEPGKYYKSDNLVFRVKKLVENNRAVIVTADGQETLSDPYKTYASASQAEFNKSGKRGWGLFGASMTLRVGEFYALPDGRVFKALKKDGQRMIVLFGDTDQDALDATGSYRKSTKKAYEKQRYGNNAPLGDTAEGAYYIGKNGLSFKVLKSLPGGKRVVLYADTKQTVLDSLTGCKKTTLRVYEGQRYRKAAPSGKKAAKRHSASGLSGLDEPDNPAVEQQPTPEPKSIVQPLPGKPNVGPARWPAVMSSQEVMAIDYPTYDFKNDPKTNDWATLFGKPQRPFTAMFSGAPGAGKSTLLMQLAVYLAKNFGSTRYVSSEEYPSLTLADKLERAGGAVEGLSFSKDLSNLGKDVKFVIIDSTTHIKITLPQFLDLRQRMPDTSFILILQYTKSGLFKGNNEWPHEVDAVFFIENGTVITSKNRFVREPGTIQVFKD